MISLRPYQFDAVAAVIESIKNGENPLLTLPTGSGKSECFFAVCSEYLKLYPNHTICILLNRVNLLDQTVKRISKIFSHEDVGIVCSSRNKNQYKKITVATIQSVKNRRFNLVIVDEAHVVDQRVDSSYMKFLKEQGTILGVTATAWRSSGYIYGNKKLWKNKTYEKPIIEMIEDGYLVKPIIRKSTEEFNLSGIKTVMGDYDQGELAKRINDRTKVGKQVNDALAKALDRKSIAWVCTNISHAEMVHEKLKEYGENSSILHSKMSDNDIYNNKILFEDGKVRNLVSVSMITYGWDCPRVDCIALMRPTKSSSLFVQIVGRALRPYAGKDNALILDFGRCVENCGPINEPIVRGAGRGNVLSQGAPVKFCPSCLTMIHAAMRECEFCGYEFPAPAADKNLTSKSDERDILSGSIKEPEWIAIKQYVSINRHVTKKGAECLKITYYPVGFFRRPINEYVMDFNMGKKLAKLNLDEYSVEKWIGHDYKTSIVQVKVDYQNGFANIVETI